MRYSSAALMLFVLALNGCSSSDNSAGGTEMGEQAVSGEFHSVLPDDVDAYVSNFQEERSRVSFVREGTNHSIEFVGVNDDDRSLFAAYDNSILQIGFDVDKEVPLNFIGLSELDGEVTERFFVGDDLIISNSGEDFIYSGTLKASDSDEEIEVMLTINESFVLAGSSSLTVAGTDVVLIGDLGTETYIQVRDLIAQHPEVTRLVLQESSGSVNDDINMHTGRLIRAAGLATHVPADGDINSGAVDLFTAGVNRTVEDGAKLGVHSWCCAENGSTADKLPRSSEEHGPQLTYFREMLGKKGEDFYFFTLQASPFNDVHVMTRDELMLYEFTTL